MQKRDRGALLALAMAFVTIVLANVFPWRDSLFIAADTIPAWITASIGVLGALVSLWAVVLLRDTLEATRMAAAQAELGVEAARAAVEEAKKSNVLVSEAYLSESRPWLKVDMEVSGDLVVGANDVINLTVLVTASNIGKTPARNLHFGCHLWTGVREGPMHDGLIRHGEKPFSLHGEIDDVIFTHTRDGAVFRGYILMPGDTARETHIVANNYNAQIQIIYIISSVFYEISPGDMR